MSNVRQQIEDMVGAIFGKRQHAELIAATREQGEIQTDHNQRGMLNSGMYALAVMRAYDAAVTRAVERTLEELAADFRQAGRRDATLFWNIVHPKILTLAEGFSRSAMATAAERSGQSGGSAARKGAQALSSVGQLVAARVNELRLRSQFITLKTPDDRKANGVPDVAVMMWFPDPKKVNPEVIQAANERYGAIKEAVVEASNGQATANKFDDPSVTPQDRISASIETWLEKAAVVICDLAGQRPNVYYEFGYARASTTDVLLTCPLAEASETSLHLGHWQRIEYGDAAELKAKLVEKLKVLLTKYDLSGSL